MIPGLSSVFGVLKTLLEFIKKNPKFFLGVVFMLVIFLLFRQCEANKELKHQIEVQKVEMENESNRLRNNLDALKDSVVVLSDSSTYLKGIVRVKNDELDLLSGELTKAKSNLESALDEIENAKIKNVFVTNVSSNVATSDVLTKVDRDSLGNFSVGISDSNQVYSVDTKTWFKLVPGNNELSLELVNKYGDNRSSFLNHKLNFSLTLGQVELPDGKTRIMVQPTDMEGNLIPSNVLSIPFTNGAEFMDIEPQTIELPQPKKSRRGFGLMVGPSYGLYNTGNGFQPTWGIGVTVGYKIF